MLQTVDFTSIKNIFSDGDSAVSIAKSARSSITVIRIDISVGKMVLTKWIKTMALWCMYKNNS